MNYSTFSPERLPEHAELIQRIAELEAAQASFSSDQVLFRSANKFLNSLLDTLDVLVVVVDSQGKIVRLNQAFRQTIGGDELLLGDKPFWDMFLLPDDIASVRATLGKIFAGQTRTATEKYWLTKDGNLRLIAWSFTALRNSPGHINNVVLVGVDITEREQAEENLRASKERYQLLFNSVNDAVFVYSVAKPGGKCSLIEVNEIACRQLGYSRDELLKLTPVDIEIPINSAQASLIAHKLQQQGHALFEAVHVTKDGREIPVEVNAHLFSLYGVTTVLSVARDISERKVMEEKLHFVTMHDSLTGLYNRTYFDEEIHRLGCMRDMQVGVIICDLDGLKQVNDSLGHQVGDSLLKLAAKSINASIRDGDFAARIGGDEFAIMLHNIGRSEIEKVCERIRHNISRHNSRSFGPPLSLSLGYSLSVDTTHNIQLVVKEADDNMYREKLTKKRGSRGNLLLLKKNMEKDLTKKT